MKHKLMTIGSLEITYGDMREEDYADVIPYRVTREGDALGTDFVEGKLPACTPLKSYGFSEEELWDVESIMRDNMQIVYDRTRKVGAWAEPEKAANLANDSEETMSRITTKAKLAFAKETAAKTREATERTKLETAEDYEAIAKKYEAAAKTYEAVFVDYEATAKTYEVLTEKYGEVAKGYRDIAKIRAEAAETVEVTKIKAKLEAVEKAAANDKAERELAKALNAAGRGAEYFDAIDDPKLMNRLLDEFGFAPKKA